MPSVVLSSVVPGAARGKSFVFTGKLASMARARAHRCVEDAGGQVRSTVSRHTDYLVVGEDGWPLEEGDVARKLQAGQRVREGGGGVEILTERQWLDLLGLESKYPLEDKLFTAKTCCQLLKLSFEQLRQWRRLGLIEPVRTIHREELFNFQDLKTLRTLNDLVTRGIRPARIRDLLRSLQGLLGDIEKPLAQLRILVGEEGVVVQREGELLGFGGQLLLNFEDVDEQSVRLKTTNVLQLEEARSAWDLYWEAEKCLSNPETHQRGLDALSQALALEPDFADVYCLMGNLHFADGRLEEARLHYEKALEIEPDYAEVWHNLGNIFDRYSNWLGAVRAYEKAVSCDPDFDSAHFNLALLYEEAGDRELAQRHWSTYLQMACDPEWAEIAREHLRDE